jgi:tetratricopeptide (TPR) repeat protein
MSTRILAAAIALLLFVPAARADDDWVGKTVLLKGNKKVKIGHTDENGKQVYVAELSGISYVVLKEKGGWLQVSQNGVVGWFDKNDAVVLADAVDYFTARIKAEPDEDVYYGHRAWAWHLKGEADIALKDYGEALRLNPKEQSWWNNRGAIWLEKKEYDKAIRDLEEAVRLDPRLALAYYNKARAWDGKKRYDKAAKDYAEALRIQPQYMDALNELAWLLATCADRNYRDGELAVKFGTKLCELGNWKVGDHLDTLAAGYAELGNFDEAVRLQTKALEDPALKGPAGDQYRQRLELYKDKKPYHQQ